MRKKGQSGIITTILIVLVALAAIAIIAAFIINQVRSNVNIAEAKSKISSVSIEVKNAKAGNNYILLQKTSSDSGVGIADVRATINGQSIQTLIDLANGWNVLESKKLWLVGYTLKSNDKIEIFIVPENTSITTPALVSKSQVVQTSTEVPQAVALLNDSSLVGYYKLDGNGVDSSGRNHDAAAVNNVSFVPGKNATAGKFLGNNSFVNIPYSSDFNVTNGFTYAAWIKADKLNSLNIFMGKYLPYIGIFIGEAYMKIQNSTGQAAVTGTSIISEGNWYHIAGTCDSDGSLKIYVNGILENATGPNPGPTTTSNNLVIGQNYASALTYQFNGTIDEVRVYNRSLSSDEIMAIYSSS